MPPSLIEAFDHARVFPDFGNARDVETLGERIRDATVVRLPDNLCVPDSPHVGLTGDDVLHGLNQWIKNKSG